MENRGSKPSKAKFRQNKTKFIDFKGMQTMGSFKEKFSVILISLLQFWSVKVNIILDYYRNQCQLIFPKNSKILETSLSASENREHLNEYLIWLH